MRRYSSGTRGSLTAILAGTAVLFWSAFAFAGVPSLGSDCGTGASIVGSDSAGKVTLGAAPSSCTLTFSVPYTNAPACTTTDETSGRGVGLATSPSGVVLNGPYPFNAGDVIDYICAEY